MTIEVHPLADTLGAEITGADLSRPGNAAQYEQIHDALLKNSVLAIREQHITPEQHIAFLKGSPPESAIK